MKPMVARMLLWLFSRTGYRVIVLSPDNVTAEGQFFQVDTLPLLVTGKRDLRSLGDLAARFSTEMPNEQPEHAEVKA